MKTVRIFEPDLLKAEEVFDETGACYSVFPRNIHVVSDEIYEALRAGGVRVRLKDPRSAQPPWLNSGLKRRTNSRHRKVETK